MIRPYRSDDLPLVRSSWARGLHMTTPWRHVPAHIYTRYMSPAMGLVLEESTTLMLCDDEDDRVVFAFLVCQSTIGVVHWAHTKMLFRRQGAQRSLWREAFGGTDASRVSSSTILFRPPVVYDPFTLLRYCPQHAPDIVDPTSLAERL